MNKNFFNKWNNATLQDDGGRTSDEYNKWQNALKKELTKISKDLGGRVIWFSKGHYFESSCLGFPGNKFVYVSKDGDRNGNGVKVNLTSQDCFNGFLVRTMKDEKDYTGGTNSYCNYENLQELIEYTKNL